MEKLNEYLKTLLSTCSYELHLEPNKAPYLVNANGKTDVANSPLLGTQISTIIFPLIPSVTKHQLPNKPEIEFIHNHSLGNFNFLVKKSPAGFLVTIRPMFSEDGAQDYPAPTQLNSPPIGIKEEKIKPREERTDAFSPSKPESPVKFASTDLETNDQDDYDDKLAALESKGSYEIEINQEPTPQIETVSAYDPAFTTTFSDTSTYDPPLRPQEFVTQHESPTLPDFPESPQSSQSPQFQPMESPDKDYDFRPSEDEYQQKASSAFAFESPAVAKTNNRMDALFRKMAEAGASDLHLSVSMPPMIRKDGKMMKLDADASELSPAAMKELLNSIIPEKNQEEFERRHDTDFAYAIEGLARFRANIFMDRKGMGGVFRIIPTKILTAEQLGLSKAIMDLCDLSKGLVVVTGPTGSGKSTTLCAMVDSINKNREDHIITIEDPIEFTHENQKCLVNQREVHNHTDSFKDALRAALREDPDILLVGEMRDLETISIAIETAETGHLVFGTLHTTTAPSTVDRIIDQFPADRQQQIRVMLSESLRGVIAQTLLPKKGGGRVAALEVLIITPAISNLIREGKTFQIPSAMQTGKAHGMVMLNDALMDLVKKGLVEPREAYIKAVDKPGFESLLKRDGMKI